MRNAGILWAFLKRCNRSTFSLPWSVRITCFAGSNAMRRGTSGKIRGFAWMLFDGIYMAKKALSPRVSPPPEKSPNCRATSSLPHPGEGRSVGFR
jgi:hypothetical protein